jgi:hypothetical protein
MRVYTTKSTDPACRRAPSPSKKRQKKNKLNKPPLPKTESTNSSSSASRGGVDPPSLAAASASACISRARWHSRAAEMDRVSPFIRRAGACREAARGGGGWRVIVVCAALSCDIKEGVDKSLLDEEEEVICSCWVGLPSRFYGLLRSCCCSKQLSLVTFTFQLRRHRCSPILANTRSSFEPLQLRNSRVRRHDHSYHDGPSQRQVCSRALCAAESGDVQAQHDVACLLQDDGERAEGDARKKFLDLAATWMERIARGGNMDAQFEYFKASA